MRNLASPSASRTIVNKIKPYEGGTGETNQLAARTSLDVVANNKVDQANGVAVLDKDGLLATKNLPLDNFSTVSVEGPASINRNTVNNYVISNFDTFTQYDIQAVGGSVSIVGENIAYTAPDTIGVSGFTLNGRTFSIQIVDAIPAQPSITSPVFNATVQSTTYTVTSSAFVDQAGNSTHESSDWQLSTSSDFSTLVSSAVNDSVHKTSWDVVTLLDTSTYYVRVRHNAANGKKSTWSTPGLFTVSIPTPVTPTITAPVNNVTGASTSPTFTTAAFTALADNSVHLSSSWQIATDAAFTNIVKSSIDDTVNKTNWSVTGLATNTLHYARVSHKSSNGKTSAWSPTTHFTTVNAFVFSPIISVNTLDYNMKSAAIAAGWDQVLPLQMTLTINNGVAIGSSSVSTHSLDTGNGFPVGTELNLVNNGKILGKGGNGGRGRGAGGLNGEVGGVGGPALRAQAPLTIINTNGTIAGGGGGGGGGGIGPEGLGNYGGGGGGGGAGFNPGASALGGTADPGGNIGAPSSAGTTSAGGAGGPSTGGSGAGGVGGALGANGGIGNNGTDPGYHNNSGVGLAAGAAGAAVIGNANITWVNNGTRLGAIS